MSDYGVKFYRPQLVELPAAFRYVRRVYYPWWHWRAYSSQRWFLV